jgi:UDP-glucose 4-epimerase
MKVLVTGGAGYIGSHTVVELLTMGHEVLIVDNLSNSNAESVKRIESITGKTAQLFVQDLRNKVALRKLFEANSIDAVIHFAGFKAVGESVQEPLKYYQNNLESTLTLCEVMAEFGVYKLVFSSSATVYGDPASVPISESTPTSATNPYGRTKLFIEEILRDLCHSNEHFRVAILRYFNPIGAHKSGLIGEDPNGIPNNLLPFIAQVAVGRRKKLSVFGDAYPTADGTGVRDYIHVVDLANGHLKALQKLENHTGLYIYNLGTGNGTSVLEMIAAFESASGKKIPFQIVDSRAGDVAESYADPKKAETELGWKAERDIHQMCTDTWNWQSKNPSGYELSSN